MAERTLELQLIAQDRMTAVFAKAERSLTQFGNRATAVGKQVEKLGKKMSTKLTLPIVGLGVAVLKTAGDFEAGMNRVGALTGATADELKQLTDEAKELGRTTQFSARQVSDAMGFMAQAGFEVNDILSATPDVLNLAAAGSIDLARAADIATNILTGYGLEVDQLAAANDVLAKTFTSTNTDLSQLGEAFKFVGPVAAGLKIPFQDTAAALGLLGNSGIQASMAGTTLRGALVRITEAVTPTGEALNSTGEIIKRLGLNFFDSEGQMKSFTGIVAELESKGATTSDIMQIFGQRAGPGLVALVSQGSEAMRKLVEELDNAGGTADEIAKKQMEGFRGQMLKLKSALEALAIAIADSGLLEFATDLAQRLTELVSRLAESNPRFLRMGTIAAAVVAALGPLLVVIGFTAQGIGALSAAATFASGIFLTKLIPGAIGLAGKLGLVKVAADGATLSMTALGTTLSLLAAFIAGWQIGKILSERFEVVRQFGISLVAGMLKMWEFIKIGAEVIWETIKHVFEAGFNFLLGLISDKISTLAQTLQKAFELTGIDAVGEAADKLFDIYDQIDDRISNTIPLQDKLASATENNIKRLAEIEDIAVELWNEVPEQVKEVGKETGTNFVSSVEEAVRQELPSATEAINAQAQDMGMQFEDNFAGFDVGAAMMDNVGQGVVAAAPMLAQTVDAALQPVRDTFATFGSELQSTEVTLPTEQFNAAVAGIIAATGPSVSGVGAPLQSAQDINNLLAAQQASLGLFADGGIATKATPGIFGERGPEALIPLSRGRQFGLGGTTIQNLNVSFPGTIVTDPTQMRIAARELQKFLDQENSR